MVLNNTFVGRGVTVFPKHLLRGRKPHPAHVISVCFRDLNDRLRLYSLFCRSSRNVNNAEIINVWLRGWCGLMHRPRGDEYDGPTCHNQLSRSTCVVRFVAADAIASGSCLLPRFHSHNYRFCLATTRHLQHYFSPKQQRSEEIVCDPKK
jgi:hypothetical protein